MRNGSITHDEIDEAAASNGVAEAVAAANGLTPHHETVIGDAVQDAVVQPFTPAERVSNAIRQMSPAADMGMDTLQRAPIRLSVIRGDIAKHCSDLTDDLAALNKLLEIVDNLKEQIEDTISDKQIALKIVQQADAELSKAPGARGGEQ